MNNKMMVYNEFRKDNIMKSILRQGCVSIWLDEIVPCLKDAKTGEFKNTVAFRIDSRTYLSRFREENGWHINWNEIPKDVEVYALALQDTNEIQGLIGVKNDTASEAAYIHWACTAPQNNKHEFGTQKYIGVGGHLFAIAADKSIEWGYEGVFHGFASSEELLNHYIKNLNAEYIGMLHRYQFMVNEYNAHQLLEVYNYEWIKKA